MRKAHKPKPMKPIASSSKASGTAKRKISDVSPRSLSTASQEKEKKAKENDKSPRDAEMNKGSPTIEKVAQPEKKNKSSKIAAKPNLVTRKKSITDAKLTADRSDTPEVKSNQEMAPPPNAEGLVPISDDEAKGEQTASSLTEISHTPVTQSTGGMTKHPSNLEVKLFEALQMIEELKRTNEILRIEIKSSKREDHDTMVPQQAVSSRNSNLLSPTNQNKNKQTSRSDDYNPGFCTNTDSEAYVTMPTHRNAGPTPPLSTAAPTTSKVQLDMPQGSGNNTDQPPKTKVAKPSTEKTHIDQVKPKKVNRPPPIVALNQPALVISNLMSCTLGFKKYYIKRIRHNKHIIYVENLTEYKHTCETMRARKINFFTFTPSEDKTKSLVLKGIDGGFPQEDILSALNDTKTEEVDIISVTNFATNNSKKLGRLLPMFLVKISATSNISSLVKINRILHQFVSWEPLKKSDNIQCKRCQRIGHVAMNCNLEFRCVKCAENHEPGQCKILSSETPVDKSAIYCVHCHTEAAPN